MSADFKKSLTERSRAQWLEMIQGFWQRGRQWIQENGELALILGLIIGFSFVFVYWYVIFIAVIVIFLAVLIFCFAPQEVPVDDTMKDPEKDLPAGHDWNDPE